MATWQAWIILVGFCISWAVIGFWIGGTYWHRRYRGLNHMIWQEKQDAIMNAHTAQKHRIRTEGTDPNMLTRVRTARLRASKRRMP